MKRIEFEDALVVEPAKVSVLDELPVGSVIDYEGTEVPEGFEKVESVINVTESQTNLNNYVETGTYFFRNSNVTPINIPAGSNGWLVVIKGDADNIVKQIWYRFGSTGNHYQMFIRTLLVGTWTDWKELSISDDVYYKNGDTYKLDNGGYYLGGTISGSAKSLMFSINVPKSLKNISNVLLNNLTLTVRKVAGGYLFQGTNLADIKGTISVIKISENVVRFTITMDTAFDSTNNTPVSVCLDVLELTFNE